MRTGWFPFLFYSTTWVGEVYFRYSKHVSVTDSTDALGDIGRVGSLSLVVFSIITFAGSILLPWVVQSPDYEVYTFRSLFFLLCTTPLLRSYVPCAKSVLSL